MLNPCWLISRKKVENRKEGSHTDNSWIKFGMTARSIWGAHWKILNIISWYNSLSSLNVASLSKKQDVKNPQTKGWSFSAQLWMTVTASCEAAEGAPCDGGKQQKECIKISTQQNEISSNLHKTMCQILSPTWINKHNKIKKQENYVYKQVHKIGSKESLCW